MKLNSNSICINGVAALVPGLGNQHGELVATEEILSHIILTSHPKPVSPLLIDKTTGIKSVAFTQDSIDFCRSMWQTSPKPSEIFAACQRTVNNALCHMLEEAISMALQQTKEHTGIETLADQFLAHIHILTFKSPRAFSPETRSVHANLGLAFKLDTPIFIQEGCAGILSAVQLSQSLLASDPNPNALVLITAENDMMTHIHQRCFRYATSENINEWMWPAIFGEGVGAMILGKTPDYPATAQKPQWLIDRFFIKRVENDWRVKHFFDEQHNLVNIALKAREVKQTFMTYITDLTLQAIKDCGSQSNLFKACIHESNPKLVENVRLQAHLDREQVPTFSREIGTLACVSSFVLLQQAIVHEACQTDKFITVSVIGESGGCVNAGNIYLKQTNGAQ